MARYSFVGQVVLNPDGSLGASLPGKAWTADVGGLDVTSGLLASPGDAPADFTTDATGCPPHVYGPDGVTTLWYSFADGPRFPVQGVDITEELLQAYVQGTLGDGTGGGGDPLPVTIQASQISDASPKAVEFIKAGAGLPDVGAQQAMRAVIGAGVGNGSSNVVVGAGDPTHPGAAAFAHTHNARNLQFDPTGTAFSPAATDVATALIESLAGGTIAGSSALLIWRWGAGAWPALPSTKPAGCVLVLAVGPTQATSVPAWLGPDAGEVASIFIRYPEGTG